MGVEKWLPLLPAGATLHVSHVDHHDLASLATAHPSITFRARVGTALWHGDKSALRLRADVLDGRPVAAGDRLGYRLSARPGRGQRGDGERGHGPRRAAAARRSSPFHFERRRLALLEPPHMHTSMLFVPAGTPRPEPGDEVDLQRPLTQTWVDAHRRALTGRSHLDGRSPRSRPRMLQPVGGVAAEDTIAAEKPGRSGAPPHLTGAAFACRAGADGPEVDGPPCGGQRPHTTVNGAPANSTLKARHHTRTRRTASGRRRRARGSSGCPCCPSGRRGSRRRRARSGRGTARGDTPGPDRSAGRGSPAGRGSSRPGGGRGRRRPCPRARPGR